MKGKNNRQTFGLTNRQKPFVTRQWGTVMQPWPFSDLDHEGQIFTKLNCAHNFIKSEQISYILGHNTPVVNTSDLPYFCMTFILEWPWLWKSKVVKFVEQPSSGIHVWCSCYKFTTLISIYNMIYNIYYVCAYFCFFYILRSTIMQ